MHYPTETLLHSVCAHAEQGEFDTALAQLDALLALDPANAAAMQLLGLIQAKKGDLRSAARILRQACLAAPHHGPLHAHLARVEWEIGLPAQAAAAYRQAIALGCDAPDILIDCAIALGKLGRHVEAIALCGRALAQAPDQARGWQTQANLLHEIDKLDQALACHERALALMPDAAGWSAKALTLDALGRLEEALACHDRALALCPDHPAMLTHRGATLGKMQRHEEATLCHARATELDPSHATAWTNLGASLCKLKRMDASIAAHDKAVSLSPSSAAMWLQRGAALICTGRHAEGLASCNAAIRLDAGKAEAWRHRALALEAQGRYEQALESVEEACALDSGCIEAIHTRANLLVILHRNAEAVDMLEQAVRHHPDNHALRFNLGLEQLRNGQYGEGWRNYQACRQLDRRCVAVDQRIPVWCGNAPLEGKRLLVHAEEGCGDVIQFCRLVPRLAQLGCTVHFVVYPALKRLLSSLDGCQMLAFGDPMPACDFRLPLMMLPQFLLRSEGDIPAATPYLSTRTARPCRQRADSGLRIGIACSGNPRNAVDPKRSLPLAALARLQGHGSLHVLQNALSPMDAAWLQQHPSVQHPAAALTDFADTAELLDTMDLVISVDTSIAHLAGALGKPLWLLLPFANEWRWKCRRSASSPWYPSGRLFHQTSSGDWEQVIDQVDQALTQFSRHVLYLRRGAA